SSLPAAWIRSRLRDLESPRPRTNFIDGAQAFSGCARINSLGLQGQTMPQSLSGGLVMRHLDFAPLYRSTIGFDRLIRLLDEVAGFGDEAASYPPYNIERIGENEYRITMAGCGFGSEEIIV